MLKLLCKYIEDVARLILDIVHVDTFYINNFPFYNYFNAVVM